MTDTPYDRPSDPAKRHSAALTDGADRAPARAMLKGTGFTDEDLARPLVGFATSWIETMRCNRNERALAQHVKRGIREAGARRSSSAPSPSPTVSRWDRGHARFARPREVIADSIELLVCGHLFDRLVCLVGGDKTIPAAAMVLARLDLPGPGARQWLDRAVRLLPWPRATVTIQDVREAVGAHPVGQDVPRRGSPHEPGCVASGARRLRRPVHGEHDGDLCSSSSATPPAA